MFPPGSPGSSHTSAGLKMLNCRCDCVCCVSCVCCVVFGFVFVDIVCVPLVLAVGYRQFFIYAAYLLLHVNTLLSYLTLPVSNSLYSEKLSGSEALDLVFRAFVES